MAIIVGKRITNISNSNTSGITGTGFIFHVFSTPGSTTFQTIGSSGTVDAFIVGGGGGSGSPVNTSGGGGGGGSTLFVRNLTLTEGVSYTATVGSGGVSGANDPSGFGGTSTLTYAGGSASAIGGGWGGTTSVLGANNPGGSGGGTGENFSSVPIGAGVIGLGFPGGGGNPQVGGGGGGAGSAGIPANGSPQSQGGAGIPFSITGTSVFYGGGGGGGPGFIHPTSFPTMFGLGGNSFPAIAARPGCIILRYIG
jgi:hypothetical protein